ncbi:hypothetical protein Tco_0937012 [Tanacetum coccineum]|uniref:Uncharacterized protein n=1 Tax=Tanacetum coccineum TaxID=301880 RepID=A0ABQ5DE50_9ASTR
MSLDYVQYRANMDTQDAEDTAFYAQLTQQILHLMDEDDETFVRGTIKSRPEFDRRPVSGGQLIFGKYYGWLEGSRSVEVPSWMENLWARNGGGTGVFIPHVMAAAKPRRRRHRRPRKNNNGERIHSSNGQMIHG